MNAELKEGIKEIVEDAEFVFEAWEDKKFSISEIIQFGLRWVNFEQKKDKYLAIVENYKALSIKDKEELSNYFNIEFDIKNDQLENLIEKRVELFIETFLLVRQTWNLVIKFQEEFKKGETKTVTVEKIDKIPVRILRTNSILG